MAEAIGPYEDPTKKAMRERCRAAIEASGHELSDDLKVFAVPKNSGLNGAIKGDLQSRTSDRKLTHAYFLRPGRVKVAPKWLMNLGEVSRQVSGVVVFLVVEQDAELLIESCRASGLGLLRLTSLDSLDVLVEPLERAVAAASKQFQAHLASTRRALEAKFDRQLNIIASQFGELPELTQGMSELQQNRYARDLERREKAWRDWSDQISAMLDEAATNRKEADLQAIDELIQEGPAEV